MKITKKQYKDLADLADKVYKDLPELSNMIKEPCNICYECGVAANVLTCFKKYGKRPERLSFATSTYHVDICDVCGERKDCTEPRDFFHPDFTLIGRVVKSLHKT